MAEIVTKNSPIRLDMTPMVDLAFLLVTFFMLTTTFTRPNMMQLAMPDKDPTGVHVSDDLTTTLVLDANNSLFYIRGAENPQVFTTNYAASGLRKLLMDQIAAGNKQQKDAIFIIKPTTEATYQNVVDALDELKITGAKVYAVQSLLPHEQELVATYKQMHGL